MAFILSLLELVNCLYFPLTFTKGGKFVREPELNTLNAGGHGYDRWLKGGVSG